MGEFLLTIAGFDPTGGAGILRDFATWRYFGFLGCGVITANTVQNTKGVKRIEFTDGEFLLAQLDGVLEEAPVKGVKLGLPHRDFWVNREIALRLRSLSVPVVFDPVLKPTLGKDFVGELSLIEPLVEVADVITPNYGEFKALEPRFGELLKEKVVVVKGVPEGSRVKDLLFVKSNLVSQLSHSKDSREVRGTGCAFSSALLSLLVGGKGVEEAFLGAVEFLRRYRKESFKLGGWKQYYSLV